MNKKMNIDNPFFQWMGQLGDFMLLNVIFLICCIPVFTIGAAMTAMYRVSFQMREKGVAYIVRTFLKYFKQEFKQSTGIWLILLVSGAILLTDLLYTGKMHGQTIWLVLGIGAGVLTVAWAFIFCYAFPLLSRFQNSTKQTLWNALLMAIRHIPYTLAIFAINSIPIICILLGSVPMFFAVPIYLAFGFSVSAYCNSFFFERVFKQYILQ